MQEKGAEHVTNANTPRAPAARSGSQLPTAMYPLRALENCVPCKGKGAYGNLQWLCRFGCQTKVQFLEKYEKTKRFIIFSSKVLGKTPKMTPGDPKNEKNDPQGGQNGAKGPQK